MRIWRAESLQHSIDRLLEVQSHVRCRQTYVVLKLFWTVDMSQVLSDQIGPICHLAHFFCTIFTSHKLHCAQLLLFFCFLLITQGCMKLCFWSGWNESCHILHISYFTQRLLACLQTNHQHKALHAVQFAASLSLIYQVVDVTFTSFLFLLLLKAPPLWLSCTHRVRIVSSLVVRWIDLVSGDHGVGDCPSVF